MEPSLSSPSPERLRCWRLFFESALALGDVLDTELEKAVGIPQRWYDVLVHLEESPGGIRMNELAERILYSKSGFTRVIDRMEEAGLVERAPVEGDQRRVGLTLTPAGHKVLRSVKSRRTAWLSSRLGELDPGELGRPSRHAETVSLVSRLEEMPPA